MFKVWKFSNDHGYEELTQEIKKKSEGVFTVILDKKKQQLKNELEL